MFFHCTLVVHVLVQSVIPSDDLIALVVSVVLVVGVVLVVSVVLVELDVVLTSVQLQQPVQLT